jgi:hypothetical protein
MAGDRRPVLDAEVDGAGLLLTDTRTTPGTQCRLEGVAARVYELCDNAASIERLLRQPDLAGRDDEVRAALDELVRGRLMLAEHGRYLSLAVFRTRTGAAGRQGLEAAAAA